MLKLKDWSSSAPRKPRTIKAQAKKIAPLVEVRLDDELLTTEEAHKLTKMSIAWFERARWIGHGGPPFCKRGRSVRYLKSELLGWWAEQRE